MNKGFQVLAAYTQEGIELSRVFPGSTTTAVFEDFINQLLHHCGRWPEPKSVLVMDNASFHRLDRIEQMCAEAGVRLTFLAPYTPDLNPIEEFFAELKTYMRKERRNHVEL
jgi:transposase